MRCAWWRPSPSCTRGSRCCDWTSTAAQRRQPPSGRPADGGVGAGAMAALEGISPGSHLRPWIHCSERRRTLFDATSFGVWCAGGRTFYIRMERVWVSSILWWHAPLHFPSALTLPLFRNSIHVRQCSSMFTQSSAGFSHILLPAHHPCSSTCFSWFMFLYSLCARISLWCPGQPLLVCPTWSFSLLPLRVLVQSAASFSSCPCV